MTPDEVLQLIVGGESQRTEFKKGFGETKEAIQSLCAFAHSDGGVVLIGVRNDGRVVGVDIGKETLEQFANTLRQTTDPPLASEPEPVLVEESTIIAVQVAAIPPDELVGADGRFYVRIGKSTHQMSTHEIRVRVLAGGRDADRPTFVVNNGGFENSPTEFTPYFDVRHFSGDLIPTFEWHLRGPRFWSDWQPASVASLERESFAQRLGKTDLVMADAEVGRDEIGFEIRFKWSGRWRYQLHKFSIANWDLGREILPSRSWDGETA